MPSELKELLIPAAIGVGGFFVFCFLLLSLIVSWRFYRRGYCPGWACLIPFYNTYCFFKIAFGNGWLFLLTLVPIVGQILLLASPFLISKNYGKGFAFGLGFLFFPFLFWAIIAFGDLYYCGPNL